MSEREYHCKGCHCNEDEVWDHDKIMNVLEKLQYRSEKLERTIEKYRHS